MLRVCNSGHQIDARGGVVEDEDRRHGRLSVRPWQDENSRSRALKEHGGPTLGYQIRREVCRSAYTQRRIMTCRDLDF